jgi:hypothetical protein
LTKVIETYCHDAGDMYLHFVDFTKSFPVDKDPKLNMLYRYKETLHTDQPDPVHLSKDGNKVFQALLEGEVSTAVKVK